jgi:hypothetical protein
MDMKQYAGSESKYLKAADLEGKNIKVVVEGVELVEFEDDAGNRTQKPCLKLKGKDKMVVCNATSVQELGYGYGFDSDDWIGKTLGLSIKHYPAFGKDGIVITALDAAPKFEDLEESDIPF